MDPRDTLSKPRGKTAAAKGVRITVQMGAGPAEALAALEQYRKIARRLKVGAKGGATEVVAELRRD